MTRNEMTEALKSQLPENFWECLVESVKLCGWACDLIALMYFLQWVNDELYDGQYETKKSDGFSPFEAYEFEGENLDGELIEGDAT